MAVLTGPAATGFNRYREAARTAGTATPSARVTTRKFGLNLGRFSVSYTQRDLCLDQARNGQSALSRSSFLDEMNAQRIREAVGRYSGPEPFAASSTLRHRGVAAYEAMSADPAPTPARALLAVI